jgi:hypothetical protein
MAMAAPATPKNPNPPAIKPSTKKIKAHFSIG